MYRTIVTTAPLLFLLATAAVGDERTQRTPNPTEQAASEVLKAFDAKDEPAIKALAAKSNPDPWIVADELCYLGQHDAAAAFAKASLSIDLEKLPAYVAARRGQDTDAAERELLVTVNKALQSRSAEKVVSSTESVRDGISGVLALQFAHARGRALRMLGRNKESMDVMLQASQAADQIGWIRRAGILYANAGYSADAAADWRAAADYWGTSLQIFRQRGDQLTSAKLLSNLGSLYSRRGAYARDLAYQQEALRVIAALKEKGLAARILSIIGVIYFDLGEFAKSLSTQEEALAQAKAVGDKVETSIILSRIASVYAIIGEQEKALAIFDGQLKEATARKDQLRMAAYMGNMSVVYTRLGEHKKSLELQKRSLAIMLVLGNPARVVRYQVNLASSYGQVGDFAKAVEVLAEAVPRLEDLGDKAGLAAALINLGAAHKELGNLKDARVALKRSERIARSIHSARTQVLALEALAGLYLDAGENGMALATALRAVKAMEGMLAGYGVEQGAAVRAQHASLFAIGALAAVREEDAPEALNFLESGRAGALLAALSKREESRWKAATLPIELKKLDEEANAGLTAARRNYDDAIRHGSRKLAREKRRAFNEATSLVQDVANRIERKLKEQTKPYYPLAETIENIQSGLVPGQAFVLYGLCQEEIVAVVLQRDAERIVGLGDISDVRDSYTALDLTAPGQDPTKVLDSLRARLVEPLKLTKDVEHVLIAPEGLLSYMPFSVLFEQTVSMTPSGTTHLRLKKDFQEPGSGILSLGSPDYQGVSKGARGTYYRGRALAPLPETGAEAKAIGTTVLLGADASEAGLRKALSNAKRWKAVHFACHGLIDVERPMFSSLALSHDGDGDDDGFLTALEVRRMRIPADLTVLSACETGTGKIIKGEGIVGLSSAFILAGAPRVLCSLWKVDDEATRALMVKFYELWNPKNGSEGLETAVALKKAQAFVRDHPDHPKWKHPYYWAAWVQWGLPD